MTSSPTPAPHFSISIEGRLPSWNQILGMHHWTRAKFKKEIADAFLSALRALENDSSTRTTSAKNTTSIYFVTLESYLQMTLQKRKLKSAKKRSEAKKLKESK